LSSRRIDCVLEPPPVEAPGVETFELSFFVAR
jgi:hypothetical protein